MKLLPKDVDIRNLLKGMLSTSLGKKSVRPAKSKRKVRSLYFHGRLNEKYIMSTQKKLECEYHGRTCGQYGEVDTDQEGNKQYRPFFCNLRRMCFECFSRYKRRILFENEQRIMAVAEANGVKAVVTPVYTLHNEIRSYLTTRPKSKQAETFNEITTLVVDSFKRAIGLSGRWGQDVTGIISVMHPFGSRNPFQSFLHFHLVWIPLKITKEGNLEKMNYWIDVKVARDLWQSAQVQFAKKHGLSLSSPDTNVNFSFVHLSNPFKFRHKVRYIFRSLVDDIFISMKYITEDLTDFAWFEDLGADWGLHVDKWDVFEKALQSYMEFPVKMVRSYGFLRNLKKYAKVLGIVQIENKRDFVPVASVPCKFRRVERRAYNKTVKRWVFKTTIQANYDRCGWHDIPIKDVVGETCAQRLKYQWVRGP